MHVINNGRETVRVVLTVRRLIGFPIGFSVVGVIGARWQRPSRRENREGRSMRLSEENGEPIVRFLLERRTDGSSIGRFLNIPTTQLPE